ncbi:MAG: hypothetical protein J5589_09500 [Firmicutes bacterium]|nr:hypothetical protein [Bacillota bacterium]
MFEIYNNLAKVQDTRKAEKAVKKVEKRDLSEMWRSVNPDPENLVNIFGATFRVRPRNAA